MPSSAALNRRLIPTLLVLLISCVLSSSLPAFVPAGLRHSPSAPIRPATSTRRYLYVDPETHVATGAGEAAKASPPTATAAATATAPAPTTTTSRSSSRRRTEPKRDHLHPVSSPEEFDSAVRSERDRLVVVRFHSPYCKACQSIAVAYDRLARSYPGIKFVDVTIEDKLDYPDLNVPATPYAHIYHPAEGLVESSPIARRQFSKFKKVLRWYFKGQCDLPEEFFSNPHHEWDMENLIL